MKIIYAIPGIGTTKELFQNISVPNYQLKVLDWPIPDKNSTLKNYAEAFIKQIDVTNEINLVGVSFGGMICSELAELLKTKNVVLISSCKDRSEFPFLLKFLKIIPLHKLFSENFIRRIDPALLHHIGFEASFNKSLSSMIQSMPPNYFTYCIRYIVNWDKKPSQKQIFRIHGTADNLLTYYNSSFNLIEGGTHAMILNKSNDINKILNNLFNEL